MSTIYSASRLERTSASTRFARGLFWRCWDAFQAWSDRQKLHTTLSNLSDRELMDIGTSRGEIDYVVSNSDIEPRDIRSRLHPLV